MEWAIVYPVKGHELYGRVERREDEYVIIVPGIEEHSEFEIRLPQCSVLYIIPTSEEVIIEKLKSAYHLNTVFDLLFGGY